MFAFIASLLLVAQQMAAGPTPGELDAMKKLDFLVGRWEGEGVSMRGPTKETSKGGETIQRKLQGKALLVEGLFKDPTTGKVVHETLATITYDEKSKEYRFDTHLFNAPSATHVLHAVENGFWWQIQTPDNGPLVKFTMKLDKGDWYEIGEVLVPGQPPLKFLEMRLEKV